MERPIDYIRERFWRGYVYSHLEPTNRDILVWNQTVARLRVAGTTKERVADRFEGERSHLGTLPRHPYDPSEKVTRKVYRDCQVAFAGNRDVVPLTLVGRGVLLKIQHGTVRGV